MALRCAAPRPLCVHKQVTQYAHINSEPGSPRCDHLTILLSELWRESADRVEVKSLQGQMKLARRSEGLERRGTSSYLRLFRLRDRGGLALLLQHDEGHLSAASHRNRPSSTGESRLRALAASLCVKVRYVHARFSLRAVPAQSSRANEVSARSLTFYLSAARGGRVQRARPRLHSLPPHTHANTLRVPLKK